MLSCFVVRPGGGWRGVVSVGLSLWTSHGPVRGDRIIFLDRPRRWLGTDRTDGKVVTDGKEWPLVEPELFDSWREGRIEYLRYRALMLEPEAGEVIGEYFWLDTRAITTQG